MDNLSCIRQQADVKQIMRCKDRISEIKGTVDYLSSGLELAGNNVRLKILFLLYEEKKTLCLRPKRYSQYDHFGSFSALAKTQRQKTH